MPAAKLSETAESAVWRRTTLLDEIFSGVEVMITRPSIPVHLAWLVDKGKRLKTADGKPVRVMELKSAKDDAILSAWAKHFRNQYCRDDQIDNLCKGTKLTRAEYLRTIKFPDESAAPGPSIRAGDFGEVLVADYLEFALEYWLPRTRYDNKVTRNESTKGTDIIGFKVVALDHDDPKDALALFEAKAKFTGDTPNARLQAAVDGSAKDQIRKAESLNAIKQRFLDLGRAAEVRTVERFQSPEDRPYAEQYGAVALLSSSVFSEKDVGATTTAAHPHAGNLTLIVIHGSDLMPLVHELYRRAADEA
jgi:hypothetical protein